MSAPRADTAGAHERGYRPLALEISDVVKTKKTVEKKKTDNKKSPKAQRNKRQEQNLNYACVDTPSAHCDAQKKHTHAGSRGYRPRALRTQLLL